MLVKCSGFDCKNTKHFPWYDAIQLNWSQLWLCPNCLKETESWLELDWKDEVDSITARDKTHE